MSAGDWLTLLLACAAGAISPGPSLVLVVRHASVSLRGGVLCSLSHALGVGLYAALAASGLALVFTRQPWVAQLIAVLAGAWLLRLAWLFWHSSANWVSQAAPLRSATRDGLLMGLVNPKVALFFLAIFTAVLPASVSVVEQAGAVLLAVGVDGTWYVLVSLLLHRIGLIDLLRRQAGVLNRFSATIFVGLATYLCWGVIS